MTTTKAPIPEVEASLEKPYTVDLVFANRLRLALSPDQAVELVRRLKRSIEIARYKENAYGRGLATVADKDDYE